jgi:hypothetical protein
MQDFSEDEKKGTKIYSLRCQNSHVMRVPLAINI